MATEQKQNATTTLEEAVKPLDCAKQILQVGEKFPASKPDLLVIAQRFTKQLTAATSKSTATTGAVMKQKIDPGTGWCLIPRQSFQTPRGVFDVEFLTNGGIYLHSKSVTHTLKPGMVERIVELKTADKYTSSSSASKTQLLLVLKEPLPVNKSKYACLLCTPSVETKTKLLSVSLFKPAPNGATIPAVENVVQGGAMEMWMTVLSHMSSPIALTSPDGKSFKSSTSGPYVKCYCNNVNNGMLFPMQLGVIFIQKPLVYVPLDQIDRIELGRGGAVSGRTFDLNLYCKDESVHRFSMIEKDELTPLATYVSETKANEQASGEGSANEASAENEEEDSGGSGEDSAYSEDESLSSASDESDDIDSEDIDLDADGPVDEKIERRTTRAMKKSPASSSSSVPKPKPKPKRKPQPTSTAQPVKQESQVAKQKAPAVQQNSSTKPRVVKTEVKLKAEPTKRSLPVAEQSSVLKEENSSMPKVKKAKVVAQANDHTDTESEGENIMCS